MSSAVQSTNNNQAGVISADGPSQILPPGTVGNNPQSTLNPNVAHTKSDIDNHANQLNPNNPRYAGHQERMFATSAMNEATGLHQQAQAAYEYANQMESAAMQAQTTANQLKQQASLYAQQASMGLSNRGGGRGRGQQGGNNDNQEGDYNDDKEQGTSGNNQRSTGNDNQALPQRQTNQS